MRDSLSSRLDSRRAILLGVLPQLSKKFRISVCMMLLLRGKSAQHALKGIQHLHQSMLGITSAEQPTSSRPPS